MNNSLVVFCWSVYMMKLGVILFLCISYAVRSDARGAFTKMFPERRALHSSSASIGDPLLLTPYIFKGEYGLARKLAKVSIQENQVDSYSGYITVSAKYNASLFFWFIMSETDYKSAPVVLWLQGGPGGSSLFGLFEENGPWTVTKDYKLKRRLTTWTRNCSMLYIDNPVGTGFSFSDHPDGYARNEEDVGRDLYVFLQQFFMLFEELKDNRFFITGESYAGKYIPALAYKIHIENQKRKGKPVPRLKGFAIGNGLIDPYSMLDYASVLSGIGLIDKEEFQTMRGMQGVVKSAIHTGQWMRAFQLWDPILNGDKTKFPTYFTNVTGYHNYFNYLKPSSSPVTGYYEKYLNQDIIRDAIHVGNRPYNNGSVVESYLLEDIPKSVKPYVLSLLNASDAYEVLFYNGQMDIIVSHLLTESFLESITNDEWKFHDNFMKSPKKIWRLDNEIAGYIKGVGHVHYAIVRNAGHMVPMDQPEHTFDLIYRFLFKGFN